MKTKEQAKAGAGNSPPASSFFQETAAGVILNVRAKPRSSKPGLGGLFGANALEVRISAAPVEGKANRAIIEVLAAAFGIPKSAVSFKSGETSKTKRLLLAGVTAARVRDVVGHGHASRVPD